MGARGGDGGKERTEKNKQIAGNLWGGKER